MVTTLLVGVSVVVVVALGSALADRICAALAERKAAAYLSEPFGHPATVRIHGTPFLTQALRGRYRDIEVSGGGLRIGEIVGATLDAHLHNAVLPLRELLGGRATELPCERVEGRILLPYGELARVSRIPGLMLSDDGGRLVASASLPVPGVSQLARVSGAAALTVAGGAVWLRVRGLSVAGISLPRLVVTQLMPSLNVPIPLPPLPYGLRLDELQPMAAGLLVCGSADDVVFEAPN
ncbi:MAG: putative secreted protein [Pseudonocardiales bacterium]|nr:putative secreted protein [Pseudonocardiales bacterium]